MLLRLTLGGCCFAVVLTGSASPSAASASEAGVVPGQYIVVLKGGSSTLATVEKHKRKYGADVSQIYTHALKGYAAKLSDSAVAAIRAEAEVDLVTADGYLDAHATGQKPGACPPACALPTGVDRIDGESSSTLSGNGSGTVDIDVAILDSGVDATQPDLNVAGGVNCTGDNLGTTVDPGKIPHGTFAGGIIGAKDDSSGIVGVAPGARLWSVRVIEPKKGITFLSWVVCGIDWVTSTRTDSDPTNDIDVANLSLGGPGVDDGNCGETNGDAMHAAICSSVAAGVVYVASAGNETQDIAALRPASYDEVLTATSMSDFDGKPGGIGPKPKSTPTWTCGHGADDTATSFSNFATLSSDEEHTVAAPGDCIYSTGNGTEYLVRSGTSFSAPHVAGVVALCIASGPCAGLTPAQIVEKIVADATAYNNANISYGFQGDPLRPISGKYYGYLIRAALY
jgi:subtilisin